MFESLSPIPIVNPNLPIALRPAIDFSPLRGSIFDDPGDEKSWHVSQRAENLSQYYDGRDPSWYASAIAPLAGADRVLDIGCGPGLALQALRDQGSSTVLGIDRWPAFASSSNPTTPIIAHDLTLPMPFLESGSFDGVLSHYVLDYVSPICARQILREVHRVLVPGGRLALYLAAVGLSGGDESRTVAYSSLAMKALLIEAGFEEIEISASSNGRNTAASARRSAVQPCSHPQPWAVIEGDTQISTSFSRAVDLLTFELIGSARAAVFSVELPSVESDDQFQVSGCARARRLHQGGTEFQFWVWRGYTPLAAECVRVEFPAREMRIHAAHGGNAGHVSVWTPTELPLEPPGSAHARLADIPTGSALNQAEGGTEGRQVVIESASGPPIAWDQLGPGRNRFLIRQASRVDISILDREWLAARLHGIAVTVSELSETRLRELLFWCGWRQCLLYLSGSDWGSIRAVVERRHPEMTGPVVLVDPALTAGNPSQALAPEIATIATDSDRLFILLTPESLERSAAPGLARISGRLLLSKADHGRCPEASEANETLRYLTERTLLMRLRQARGYSWAEVGRRPVQ